MSSIWMTTTVGEVMRPGMLVCPPATSLATMAATMVTHGVHALLVAPVSTRTPLVVTDLELIGGALQTGRPRAGDLASEPIATARADAALHEAVAIMSARAVSHLLVLAPVSGEGAGILSTLDLAAVAAGVPPRLARLVRSGPARPSASAPTLDRASVADVMHHGVIACAPDAPVVAVARVMADHRTHCCAVTGVDARPGREDHLTWALVDDLDLLGAIQGDQLDSSAATIADASPIAVHDADSLRRAATLMVAHQRRHLVAVGPRGLPSGIVSTLDVARVLSGLSTSPR
jgi:CBS domain-containing protein